MRRRPKRLVFLCQHPGPTQAVPGLGSPSPIEPRDAAAGARTGLCGTCAVCWPSSSRSMRRMTQAERVSSPRAASMRVRVLALGLLAVRQGFLAGMPWTQMRATRRPPMKCTLGSGSARRAAPRGELVRSWGVFAGQCRTGSRCSLSRLLPGSSRERGSGLLPGGSRSCRSRSFSLEAPAEGGGVRASRLHGFLARMLSCCRKAG